ncbi:MAG: bifunctional riboflavin kinase/FAD synthetase [Hyphomicrobiaceae bacterium]|nr:bifunctional riboflavin kinase/FAD synthetase [Hyphomicrobiaceae bacterium]
MLILNSTQSVPREARGAVLAIGNFDGVHRGHQALLATARGIAKAAGAPAGVMLFEPHPREVFAPDKPFFRITPLPTKLALLERFGMDVVVVLTFDRALAGLSAEAFVGDILVRDLGVRHVIVGYDFHFGKGRGGNAQLLVREGERLGFGVSEIAPVADRGEAYSSSAIRALLAKGEVARAGAMLGHWWRVTGRVVGGAKRGTGLGFPTANLTLAPGTDLGFGIYAVRVHLDREVHEAAAYLGTRPTFDDGAPVLEVFLLDFDGDLYGREIGVEFIDFIRADGKFEGMEALKVQMAADCDAARAILARAPALPA